MGYVANLYAERILLYSAMCVYLLAETANLCDEIFDLSQSYFVV